MKERGLKWSQATVWNVERGERPLRLAEARVLVDVLKPERGVFAVSDFLFSDAAASLHQDISLYQKSVEAFEVALDAALDAEEKMLFNAASIKMDTDAGDVEEGLQFAFNRARIVMEHEGLLERFRVSVLARSIEDDYEGHGITKELREEMVELGAKTLEELVEKRDEDARQRGYESYSALRESWFTPKTGGEGSVDSKSSDASS